jgi:beta-glucosidase-like glycosyl hydrolase
MGFKGIVISDSLDMAGAVKGSDIITAAVKSLNARVDALKIKQDELKEKIMKMMEDNKQKSVKTQFASYSYVAATTKKTFDTKLFKDTEPDHYERLSI